MVNHVTWLEMKMLYVKKRAPIQVKDAMNAFQLRLTDQGFTWVCTIFKDNDARYNKLEMDDFLPIKDLVRMGEPLQQVDVFAHWKNCASLFVGLSIVLGLFAIHRMKH